MKYRKVGKFIVSKQVFYNNFSEIKNLFKDIFIVRCEERYDIDGFEYVGISGFFKELEEGEQIPFYDIIYNFSQYTEPKFEFKIMRNDMAKSNILKYNEKE
jgi:hypothetical protein